ncbi:MAG TPA: MFS transporter [Actinomycetes bacterium]|jgi:MFS family permease|nr:MFS transporter [Actinomycetes bacterium]HET9290668.1 MFS transporter [Actinomycetes bacterium]
MNPEPRSVQRVYLVLMLFNTLAASFIWGINTLFLLDAGLSATAAFTANALFTAGMVLFEVPTGVVADTWGRRASYLLGSVSLAISTALYWLAWQVEAPFWAWATTSVLLGLGFTFFSGATEAWLVDALKFTGFKGNLESVFAKGQIVAGAAMLSGSVLGGLVAQWTNLGVPYILRALALVVTFVVAFVFMRDWGFVPKPGKHPVREMGQVLRGSVHFGLGNPPVRWMMLAAPFSFGVGIYAFYAMQPYLLELYGDEQAYSIAGLAAAIVAGAQIIGGMAAPRVRLLFRRRTSAILGGLVLEGGLLVLLGLTTAFWVAVGLLVLWGLTAAATLPIRQAYMNGLIPSEQRATVLSFDNLLGSSGGVVIQPALGKVADVWSYSTSYLVAAGVHLMGVPFVALARRQRASADPVEVEPAQQGG